MPKLSSDTSQTTVDLSLDAATGDKPYLGDIVVVGMILGNAQSEIIEMLAAVTSQTEKSRNEFAAKTLEKASNLAAIFLGENAEYEPVKDWNSQTGGIAPFVAIEGQIAEPDNTNIMVTFFLLFFSGAMEAVVMFDKGNEDGSKTHLDGMREQYVETLIGLPQYDYEAKGLDPTIELGEK